MIVFGKLMEELIAAAEMYLARTADAASSESTPPPDFTRTALIRFATLLVERHTEPRL